jgi:flagellar biosynthesis regulator FlaF
MENKVIVPSNKKKKQLLASIQVIMKPNTKTNERFGGLLMSKQEALNFVKQVWQNKKEKISNELLIEFANILHKEVNTRVGSLSHLFNKESEKNSDLPIEIKEPVVDIRTTTGTPLRFQPEQILYIDLGDKDANDQRDC